MDERSALSVADKELECKENQAKKRLLIGLEENPPWHTCIWLGLQHCFLSATSIALIPIFLGPSMCMFDDSVGFLAKAQITSSLYFITGLVTIMQCIVGTRLPILQGTTFTLVAPIMAVLALPRHACPEPITNGTDDTVLYNDTDGTLVDGTELWQRRMREIQGSLAVSSIFEVILGLTGATTFMLQFIGPLTIAPAIALIGLDLFQAAADQASPHWGIAALAAGLMTLFCQFLHEVEVPIPVINKKWKIEKGHSKPFALFPVLITIGIAWSLCFALTETGVLPEDSRARTDIKMEAVTGSPWFYFPYPGHFGVPTVSAAGVVAMLVAVFAGAVESIGDYHACAKLVDAPPPPRHAVARGITVEGIGCVVAGLISGSGSTSFSNNIAALGITKVGSRKVMIVAGILMTVLGMFCKFGAMFVMVPAPIIGGVVLVTFGLLSAIGFSMLQYVDMDSLRNQYVLGFSLFLGLVVPQWMKANPGAIDTGVALLDQTLTVLLQTAIFVGGFTACFLDNTIKGTLQERGILAWKAKAVDNNNSDEIELNEQCYELPFSTSFRFAKYIPILPEYDHHRDDTDSSGILEDFKVLETSC